MRWSFRTSKLVGLLALCGSAALACGGEGESSLPAEDLGPESAPAVPGVDCEKVTEPTAGCPCNEDDDYFACGTVNRTVDGYLECSEGFRFCTDGEWSVCQGNRIAERPAL